MGRNPQVGLVPSSPLSSRGVPDISKPGTKSEVAHSWAWWLRNPCRLGCPQRFEAGEKIRSGPQVGPVAT